MTTQSPRTSRGRRPWRAAPRLQLLLFAPVALWALGQLVGWGGSLWLGHRVQAAADAGLRAAAASSRADEQDRLARIAAAGVLPGDERSLASRVALQRRADGLVVQVSYDASDWPIYRLRSLLPLPPATVVKIAREPAA